MNKHFFCICVIVVGMALGYAIGNSASAQSCQCDEDRKCCISCSYSHGEKKWYIRFNRWLHLAGSGLPLVALPL